MAKPEERPPGTQLIIDESYVQDIEQRDEQSKEMVQRWRNYMGHLMDFLEIIREHFDNFDQLREHFNEADNRVNLVIDTNDEIKFQPDENEESRSNS